MTHLSTLVEIAADLRRRSRQRRPPYSTQKIEKCFPRLVVMGGELPDDIDELVTRSKDGDVIVYSRSISSARQRFAIAHAFAHLIFDMGVRKAACIPGRIGDPATERRADQLGAETLVPFAELQDIVRRWKPGMIEDRDLYLDHVDRIASRYHVPSALIDQRIRWLEWSTKLCN